MNCATIPEFYGDKSVFITGATGFLGKLVVEKLLRSCPGIDKIYLLVRSKNDKNPVDRLKHLTNSTAFDILRESHPKALNKIILIEGDISCLELGISKSDQEILCEKVSIIINSAASVKFNSPLKAQIFTNLRSLRELISLARRMKNLKSFIHTSTAYSNFVTPNVKEEVYPVEFDPHAVIHLCENFPDRVLNKIAPCLLKNYPNSYTFTKSLAENLAFNEGKDLPLAIVRPSMIGACMTEPKVGWADTYTAITPFLDAIAKGVVTTACFSRNNISDVIPADIVVKTLIAASWKVGNENFQESTDSSVKVYNSVSGDYNPITFEQFTVYAREVGRTYPAENMVWYPQNRYHYSKLQYEIDYFFTHLIPAYFVDLFAKFSGKKARAVKIVRLFQKGLDAILFVTTSPYKFKSDKCDKLLNSLNIDDRDDFHFDLSTFNWSTYYKNYFFGIQKFILNEEIFESDKAKRKLKRLKYAKYCTTGLLAFLLLYIASKIINFFNPLL